ncbi:hypothetical protein LTR36_007418 [Oleoguttula mirabilis]|uniref:Erythromycin biosynthesis protein CIII-like C-terminal domain-containing protein n=1 Tax=Oleoguttula mirabilis TaxID=1507867 RepID=A0AAV9J9D2_9PEZI|nr:hypothetical protein LTR36_007418 [Oleoguttula mirabilis]
MGSMGIDPDIHVVMAAVPAYGHVRPTRSLAQSLTKLGYPVTFITGHTFRKSLEAIKGVDYVQLQGNADLDPDRLDDYFPGRSKIPKDAMAFLWDLEHLFYDRLAAQQQTLDSVLGRPELAHKKVVVVADAVFTGLLPMLLDSPHAKRVPVVSLGHFPLLVVSKDTAPFGLALPSQGEEKNMELNASVLQMMSGVYAAVEQILAPYECVKPIPNRHPVDILYRTPDIYCQLCVPQLEPPRSDVPENVRFVGTLLGANEQRASPEWFQSFVVDDNTERPLVMVTSGTNTSMDPNELIIPTIEACRSLPVRLIICAVHAHRPEDFVLPENARWAEWIPFEELFKHTALVVSNGGYGGISQALAAGIPMILAGLSEDKAETCARGAMTGAAINLKTQTPTVEQVHEALETMLKGGTFKQKALELKKAYAAHDAVGSIVEAVNELANKFYAAPSAVAN